mmetsp:Transcript_16901/g.32976  ORF Transcript_16901/g.32976 Transcript_16901/m.32976 type:complete len:304 (-) Transcript_16901:514-1425(-)
MKCRTVEMLLVRVKLEGCADTLKFVEVEAIGLGGIDKVLQLAAHAELSTPDDSHGCRAESLLGTELLHLVERRSKLLAWGILHPAVAEHFLAGEALVWVGDKHTANKILGIFGDVGPLVSMEFVSSTANLLKEFPDVLMIERRVSYKKNVKNYTHGPDITGRAIKRASRLNRDNLGCYVVRRPNNGLVDVWPVHNHGESKVGDFDLGIFSITGEDQILWLEISVENARIMQRLYCSHDLDHQLSCILLSVSLPSHNAVEQFFTFQDFHDNCNAVLLADNILELNQVRCITPLTNALHDLDLIL